MDDEQDHTGGGYKPPYKPHDYGFEYGKPVPIGQDAYEEARSEFIAQQTALDTIELLDWMLLILADPDDKFRSDGTRTRAVACSVIRGKHTEDEAAKLLGVNMTTILRAIDAVKEELGRYRRLSRSA